MGCRIVWCNHPVRSAICSTVAPSGRRSISIISACFVIGRGPAMATGRVLGDGHIVDLAPTILSILGVEPPPHMDGRAWAEFTGGAAGPEADA